MAGLYLRMMGPIHYHLMTNLENRGFDVVFSKDVPGPVTIEYESYVDLEMLENVGAVDKDGTKKQSAVQECR